MRVWVCGRKVCVRVWTQVWERENLPFDKDLNGISHKFSCHLQNIMR